jgi:bifunctional non-homologous end joining protein LigD
MGYYDEKKRLVYAGRVGTGFDDKLLADTFRRLRQLEQSKPPTDLPPPARERSHAHWVKPTLVAEIKFTGWTRGGSLRHPAFVAFRSDKPAAQVVREVPAEPEEIKAMAKSTIKKERAGKGPKPQNQTGDGAIAGVQLSHPDKVLYPDNGITKRDVADYYAGVQEWMLPHIIERPLALVRCPGGLASKCFFQRNWTETLPPQIGKVDIGEGRKKEFHVTISDLSGIIALAQIGVLEMHTWNCRVSDIERPDQIIFDLDPGPDLNWKRIVEATRLVNRTLESLQLPTFLKTSGGKGLHITVPIEPNVDWDSAKSFCATISKSLAEKSDLFVANMRKDLRGGKVYLDYNRNGRTATAVAPYSTRARAGAPVSMPISWDELGRLKSANQFNVKTALQYIDKRKKDPWRDFEKSRVDLHKIIGRRSAA